MQILERLRQLFFYTLKKTACKKEKPPIEAKKEHDEKRIGKILVFKAIQFREELV